MKKIFFISIFFYLFSNPSLAQDRIQHVLDSLKLELKNSKHDSIKYKNLTEIAQKYWSLNPSEGLIFAKQALNLAKKMNSETKLAEANGILGMNHLMISNNDSGMFYLEKSLLFAEKIKNNRLIGLACGALGNVYYFLSNYPQAIDYYLKSLKASEAEGNKREEAACLSNIGAIYSDLNELDKALSYFKKALNLNMEIGFKIYQAVNLSNIASIYSKKKKLNLSLTYFFRSLKVNKEIGELTQLSENYTSIGLNYLELNNLDSAFYFANLAISQSKLVQVKLNVAHGYILFSHIFYKAWESKNKEFINKQFNGKNNLCLKIANAYSDSAISIFEEANNQEYLQLSYKVKSEIEQSSGNYKSALEYHIKYTIAHDSIFNDGVNKQLAQKSMQYEFDKKQAKQNAEQEKKDIEQRNIRNSMAIGLTGTLIFSIVVFRQRNNLRRASKLILQQKKEVEEQKEIVVHQNGEILASINYAKRIQSTILPPRKVVKNYLENSFILYLPKDIVAGDFYWMETSYIDSSSENSNLEFTQNNHSNIPQPIILLAACDCTGHGVPGALVSVVCSNALNRTVKENHIYKPASILDKVAELVVEEFSKDENENVQDGMDISICSLNTKNLILNWAGANNPLWIIRKKELIEFKADKQPVGKFEGIKPFTNHVIQLEHGDTFYLFTDGFSDQFGGENNKKLRKTNFRQLLLEIQELSMEEQRDSLHKFLNLYKGSNEQVDDVLVIGVRV